MDEIDGRIVSILQVNGRASNAEIARQIGVSEGTIRRRVKKLVEEEIIKVVAIADPAKIGYACEAIVGIQVDPDKGEQVADALAKTNALNWVAVTTGSYDIFVWPSLLLR